MALSFDDDECYCLLLALNSFCEEYVMTVATAGEANHLKKTEAVRDRMREWYDARRIENGHRPLYRQSTYDLPQHDDEA